MQRFHQISISLASPNQAGIDSLIVGFFRTNASPTDEQVHALAKSVNLTPEKLEERIYQMFSQLLQG